MKASRGQAIGFAAVAAGALLACPIDPVVSPLGLSCHDPGDPCPQPFVCANGSCQPAAGGTSGGLCPSADGGVRPAGTAPEQQSCTAETDCACGLSCVQDLAYDLIGGGGQLCEAPCASTRDCDLVDAACQAGFCRLAICGLSWDAGPGFPEIGFPLAGSCSLADAGDGSCVPAGELGSGQVFGLCELGGAAALGQPCAGKSKGASGIVCELGDGCLPPPDGGVDAGAVCQRLCSPDGGSCSAGEVCRPNAVLPIASVCEVGP
ncbi:MAG: hypothetical protein ACYDCL_03815 [Myxococcales bacterium]